MLKIEYHYDIVLLFKANKNDESFIKTWWKDGVLKSKVNLIILIGGASEVINKPAIDMCEYIKDLSETRRKEKKKRSRLKLVQEKW